eukprot:CAMPEP_0172442494 /NCGR_PEP_ID=MMETSP1065-20121228/2904_1 /TAXON_ID=265537 /ORGANISM="Amphiprora paludosa, Strain CCMP125" /LENGTH=570 /DNA_ID=CAMNT_0013192363 /DNA_START=158 /DNA_END=1870 /DNA_ORIENTATION=+
MVLKLVQLERMDEARFQKTKESLYDALLGLAQYRATIGGTDETTNALTESLGTSKDRQSTDAVVKRVCKQWARCLISDEGYEEASFAKLGESLARAMIRQPKNAEPLTMLGWVTEGVQVSSQIESKRICLFVTKLTELCISAFENLEACGVDSKQNDVFQRLCPLLVLRRIPSKYFQIARTFGMATQDIAVLARHLSERLKSSGKIAGSCSTEERRLAAEVSGRVLPLGNDSVGEGPERQKYSLYDAICYPLLIMHADQIGQASIPSDSIGWGSSRSALYAMCSFCSSNVEDSDHELVPTNVLVSIVDASVTYADINPGEIMNDSLRGEVERMQSGCCDFFSLCFALGCGRSDNVGDNPFDVVTHRLLHVLKNEQDRGEPAKHSLRSGICIWNSLVLCGRRVPQPGLDRLALAIVPWILKWREEATKQPSSCEWDDLDTAAAMQFIFTVSTRRKSVQFFSAALPGVADSTKNFENLLKWAVDTLRLSSSDASDMVVEKSRREALKLLLVLTTLGSLDGNLLAPKTLSQLLSALHEVHANEKDEQFRTEMAATLSVLLNPASLSQVPNGLQ